MHQSQIDIKIGCNGDEKEEDYQHISVSFHLQEAKINEHNKTSQKYSNLKRTPFLTLQLENIQGADFNEEPLLLFGAQLQVTRKIIVGRKLYIWFDFKDNNKSLFAKKMERVFHLMTQLKTEANFKIGIHEANKISEGLNLIEYFNGLKVKGNVKIDDKSVELLRKCLVKVSPKFIESPIFIFLQMLISMDFKIDLESLDNLDSQSKDHVLSTFFTLGERNSHLNGLLLKLKQKPAKLTVCLQKLALVQIQAPSQLMALIWKI